MSSRPGTAPNPGGGGSAEWTRRDLLGHKQPVSCVAWSASGKRLASGDEEGVVKIWHIDEPLPKDGRAERSQQDLQHASKDKEVIVALAFNPRREELLAVVGSSTTKIYDLRSRSASVVLTAATPQACAAAWDSHDQLLIAQVRNGVTHLDAKRKRVHKAHTLRDGDEIVCIALSEIGGKKEQQLLVGTKYGVEVWSWPGYEHLTTLAGGHACHHGRLSGVTALAVSSKDRFLASGGYDASVCIWDLPTATPLAAVYTPDDAVRAISFSSDHNLLAYSSQSAEGQQGSVDVVGVQSGKLLQRIPLAHHSEDVAFNPRWPRLLACAGDTITTKDSKNRSVVESHVTLVLLGK
ncbi:WD40-repeat-containing domain protein [Scenedesmus sp. NREL 46B-D3]|nr:WD40-repeat-containing domain protein [Scenedesmus sp. NREL 46B-D3]